MDYTEMLTVKSPTEQNEQFVYYGKAVEQFGKLAKLRTDALPICEQTNNDDWLIYVCGGNGKVVNVKVTFEIL